MNLTLGITTTLKLWWNGRNVTFKNPGEGCENSDDWKKKTENLTGRENLQLFFFMFSFKFSLNLHNSRKDRHIVIIWHWSLRKQTIPKIQLIKFATFISHVSLVYYINTFLIGNFPFYRRRERKREIAICFLTTNIDNKRHGLPSKS